MLGEERREYILNLVKRTGSVSAIDIAKNLDVSETTIRRDLNRLAQKKLIRRTYGGALNIDTVGQELKFDVQKDILINEKKKIALAASRFVEEGDVILIEAGTTGLQTALNITNIKNLTVITNSIDIASILERTNPSYHIILSGGFLRAETHSLIGPIAEYSFKNINVDKAFIGISGIDINKGITAVDQIEAQTKKAIINSAKTVFALCDHSKFSRVSMSYVAPINAIDIIITDSEVDKDLVESIKELDIQVIVK